MMADIQPRVALLCPTGAGSLGDQAMIDSAVGYLAGRGLTGTIVLPHAPKIRHGARVRADHGPVAQVVGVGRTLWRASHVAYIGADVLDGVYGGGPSLKRLKTLALAHRMRRRTRVFGSSWSKTPAPSVVDFLRRASWLDICARDPISADRMENALDRPVRLVADLAFLLEPAADGDTARETVQWCRSRRAAGDTVLGVNLSGHTIRTLPEGAIKAIAVQIEAWLSADPARSCVLLPHDTRPGMVGDGVALDRLFAALPSDLNARIRYPRAAMHTWELKAIAGEVNLILTGRMHLAIAALGQGVPPLCIVYQGKFEGLMAHFELDGLTLDPQEVMRGGALGGRLEKTTARAADLGAYIRSRLPTIRNLALDNFAGFLPDAPEDGGR